MDNINTQKLLSYLLNQEWQIKTKFKKDGAKFVVHYEPHNCFLRFNKNRGFFWDVVSDKFVELEAAIVALSNAPSPFVIKDFNVNKGENVKNEKT